MTPLAIQSLVLYDPKNVVATQQRNASDFAQAEPIYHGYYGFGDAFFYGYRSEMLHDITFTSAIVL